MLVIFSISDFTSFYFLLDKKVAKNQDKNIGQHSKAMLAPIFDWPAQKRYRQRQLARYILSNHMDRLMALFKASAPDFHNTYFSARVIVAD
jgi:hypothetical protein